MCRGTFECTHCGSVHRVSRGDSSRQTLGECPNHGCNGERIRIHCGAEISLHANESGGVLIETNPPHSNHADPPPRTPLPSEVAEAARIARSVVNVSTAAGGFARPGRTALSAALRAVPTLHRGTVPLNLVRDSINQALYPHGSDFAMGPILLVSLQECS